MGGDMGKDAGTWGEAGRDGGGTRDGCGATWGPAGRDGEGPGGDGGDAGTCWDAWFGDLGTGQGDRETWGPVRMVGAGLGTSRALGMSTPRPHLHPTELLASLWGLQPLCSPSPSLHSYEGKGVRRPRPRRRGHCLPVPAGRGGTGCRGGPPAAPHQPGPEGLARAPVPGAAAPHLPLPTPHVRRYHGPTGCTGWAAPGEPHKAQPSPGPGWL